MAVEGTIQNGPLMEHTSYSGGDKVARVTANHAPRWMVGITGRYPETGFADLWARSHGMESHFPKLTSPS